MEKSQVISTEINGFFYKIIASLIFRTIKKMKVMVKKNIIKKNIRFIQNTKKLKVINFFFVLLKEFLMI